MAGLKRGMEKVFCLIYHLAALLTALSLMGYWTAKIPAVLSFYKKISKGKEGIALILKEIGGVQAANLKFLPYEAAFFLVTILLWKWFARRWEGICQAVFGMKKITFEHAPSKERFFRAIYRVDLASDGSKTSSVFAIPYKFESEDISRQTAGRNFADGLIIGVHGGESVEVSAPDSANAEPLILSETKLKRVDSSDGAVYMKVLSEKHKVPVHTNKSFHLKSRDPFCKTYAGTWERIPLKEQLWRAETGTEVLYFLLEDHYGEWKAVCHSDPSLMVTELLIKSKSPVTGNPNKLHLTCIRAGEREFTVDLDYMERYYRQDVDNGHESKIEADSDQRPCVVAGVFGYVGCGKTSLLTALSRQSVKGKMAALTGCQYAGEELDPAYIRRTLIEEQSCIHFPIISSDRNPSYNIYFLDLSGEMSRGKREDATTRGKIIESIGALSDVIIEVFDDRALWNEDRDGDINNVYTHLGNVKRMSDYDFLCVCSKGDYLRDRIEGEPLFVHGSGNSIPLYTKDSFVFSSVTEAVNRDGIPADLGLYTHMALAKDILSGAESGNIIHDKENDKCFIVSSGTCDNTGAEVSRINTKDEFNCELLLAYIMQLKFGISLNDGREFSDD